MRYALYVLIPLIVALILLSILVDKDPDEPTAAERPIPAKQAPIPDFAAFKDVKRKKQAFFEYMLPMVRRSNEAVLAERRLVLDIREKLAGGGKLDSNEQERLNALLQKYRVKTEQQPTADDMAQLLTRVDVVPASLILAQAANESAWGTSRFAAQAYNFFGIWCFEPGCGLTPRLRDDGLTHEVAKFKTIEHGVAYYLRTINTNHAYRDLRRIRAQLRGEDSRLSGHELAEGLLRYSERGREYVEEIQAMIRINQ
ncbi:MAG: glucosaminidase domain-containing protein, partial [Pseudomonadales bacterium]